MKIIFRSFCLSTLLSAGAVSVGCGGASAGRGLTEKDFSGDQLHYSFGGIDGQIIGSSQNLGRVTAILFVTTFDVASQAQARRLEDLYRTHVPRINAVAVVLEAPRYVDLARTFREVLGLHYPVAMVDQYAIKEHPILAKVRQVPTWIFVDKKGRMRAVVSGSLSPEQLEKAARDAE